MDSKSASARVKSGGTQISRRTVARGVAWSAPIAAIAYAAPAFASSPGPVVGGQCGVACKHPGEGQNNKTYHFTFCFTANQAVDNNLVTLVNMVVGGVPRPAYAGEGNTTITVVANQNNCYFVDAEDFGDSASNTAILNFTYTVGGQVFNGCAVAQIVGDVCGTSGSSPLKDQPKQWPHAATGEGLGSCTPSPGAC